MNAFLTSGFYDTTGNAQMPDSDWYHTIVSRHSNEGVNYQGQLAMRFHSDNFYLRRIVNNTPAGWNRIWTSTDFSINEGAVGSTVVVRSSGGYIFATYLNQSSSNDENPTISQVMVQNGSDGYLRKASMSHFFSQAPSSSNAKGTRTISAALPSGGSDGDIWYVV
jgi:hypothetical protein